MEKPPNSGVYNMGCPRARSWAPYCSSYVNDVQQVIKNSKITLYADDTAIFYASKQRRNILQRDMDGVCKWLKNNKQTLNIKKTKVMIFWPRRHIFGINIDNDNDSIETVNTFKYLGLWFDSHLSWESHVDNMCTK